MRQTGRYWTVTVISAFLVVVANVFISNWDLNRTPDIEYWLDIVPSGLGMASLITSTLIVGCSHLAKLSSRTLTTYQAIIASVSRADMAVSTGSKCAVIGSQV